MGSHYDYLKSKFCLIVLQMLVKYIFYPGSAEKRECLHKKISVVTYLCGQVAMEVYLSPSLNPFGNNKSMDPN